MRKIAALVMALLLALYIAVAGVRAVQLLASGEALGIAMGAALLVLPMIGVWALFTEVRFGLRLERLVQRLKTEGAMPEPLPAVRFGRAEPEAAQAAFVTAKADVEANPEAWRSWLRLSMAYDAAGDRRRARRSARTAIQFAKEERAL